MSVSRFCALSPKLEGLAVRTGNTHAGWVVTYGREWENTNNCPADTQVMCIVENPDDETQDFVCYLHYPRDFTRRRERL